MGAGNGEGAPGALATTIGEYYLPYGASVPVQWYGWIATRYINSFNVPDAAPGPIAVAYRKHAQLNEKAFMRGKLQEWDCRAGQNSLIIRTDGTLAPCFPMYNANHFWGVAGNPCFEKQQLADIKQQRVRCNKSGRSRNSANNTSSVMTPAPRKR